MIKMRKSQIRMMETIMVSFFLVMILFIGLTVYSNIRIRDTRIELEKSLVRDSIAISQLVINSPLLTANKPNTIDIYKVLAINGDDFNNYFSNLMGYGSIRIIEIYPEQKSFLIYNNPLETKTNLSYRYPVILFNYSSSQSYLGYIEISKQYKVD